MDNSVKAERLSPILFELKYEMDTSSSLASEHNDSQTRIESPQQFQQQILRSPFMSDKQQPSSSILPGYSAATTSCMSPHSTSAGHSPTHAEGQNPLAPNPSADMSTVLLSNPSSQTGANCYTFIGISDHCSPVSSSPQQVHSSSPPESSTAPANTASSSAIPCSSSIDHSSSIQGPSNLSCPSRLSNIVCSSSSGGGGSHSPLLSTADLLPREVDVTSLVGNGVTISRSVVDPSRDAATCGGDGDESSEEHHNGLMDRDDRQGHPRPGGGPGSKTGAGISDAVTKILDDVDWSIIPMANNGRQKVHVKRPMNAFMVWAQEARRKLSGEHRQVHNAELSKSLGKIWRGMSDEQKHPFIERADQLRQKHKQEYPNYKYQPRRRKENVKTVAGKTSPSHPSQQQQHQQQQQQHQQQQQQSPHIHSIGMVQHQQHQQQHSAFVSLKGGLMGVPPLSPPHSPTTTASLRPEDAPPALTETVFVNDCLTVDSLEGIDRAEMNRYLWPDQGMYSTQQQHPGVASSSPNGSPHSLTPAVASSSSSPHAVSSSPHPHGSAPSPLAYPTPLQPQQLSRVLGPPPLYSGPTYCSVASPVVASASPENGEASNSSSSSPPPPPADLVELQPPRRDEPLPSLSSHKGVNPFLANNICYSQHYPYNYSYSYAAMWH